MNTFLEFKCRSWIFVSGVLAFLTFAVFLPCYGGSGGGTLPGAVFSAVTISSFVVLFWVGVLRLFNPPPKQSPVIIDRNWDVPSVHIDKTERELCKV